MLTSANPRQFASDRPERRDDVERSGAGVRPPAETFAEHAPALLARALFLTSNHADAWDLVQDTFERALRRRPPVPQHELRRWLLVVIHHLHLDRCRHARRRRSVTLTEDMSIPSPGPEAAEPSWTRLAAADVSDCVNRLDPRLRDAYLLHSEHRLRLAAVAERLGIPIATAGTRVFRARRQLRALLARRVSQA